MSYNDNLRVRKPLIFVQDESERSAPRPETPELDPVEQPDLKEALKNYRSQSDAPEDASVIEMLEKPAPPKKRTTFESVMWIVLTCLILYYGNGKLNFFAAAHHHLSDPAVVKRPFYIGCICLGIVLCIWSYLTFVVRLILRDPRHFDHAAPGALSAITLFGIMAYGLFTVTFWPVFGGWIIPMIWSFFMASVVVGSLVPAGSIEPNPKYLHLRTD